MTTHDSDQQWPVPQRRFLTRYDRASEGAVPPREHITPLLSRATIAFDALKAQWRRGMELSTHERQAMAHLWESGRLSIGELGERLGLSRAAMTALTDRMEEMGYVERTADEIDRRRTLLTMTERPYVRLTPLALPYHQALMRVVSTFDDHEWAAVVRMLDTLHEVSQEQAEALLGRSDDELQRMCDEAERRHEASEASSAAAGANGSVAR